MPTPSKLTTNTRLALLMGNRFNPWHLQAFTRLRGAPTITGFRAESEIQRYFEERDDGSVNFQSEPIHFDTQAGPWWSRLKNTMLERYGNREPRIVPFHTRLKDFDLVQTWETFTDWSEQGVEAREKYGIPLAVMVWDNIPFNMENNPVRQNVKRRVLAAADRFLVYTKRSRRTLMLEGVQSERICRLNPGINLELFSPLPKGVPDPRRDFGANEDEFIILFVGWFLPRKGIDFLLLALRELAHDPELRGRRLRLLIVGSGPGKPRVEALISRLGLEALCTFTGSLSYKRMPDVYRAADVFVLPSIATPEWQEQFGMSLIEAMACEMPTISTLSGCIPEIVHDAGLLCQPNDFLSLYEAIKSLLTDPERARTIGKKGRAHAVNHFDVEAQANALSDIYETMLR